MQDLRIIDYPYLPPDMRAVLELAETADQNGGQHRCRQRLSQHAKAIGYKPEDLRRRIYKGLSGEN